MKPLIVVATLTVRRDQEGPFRAYEAQAAAIVDAVGGTFERVIRLIGNQPAEFQEVHVLSFPNRDAFASYRAHPDLLALADVRSQAVLKTEVRTGYDLD